MPNLPPVVIQRELDAPIERVFRAWTQPENIKQWFKHSETSVVEGADIDLRTGGRYRFAIRTPEDVYVVVGEYTEINPPKTIEFTWAWEGGKMEENPTLVRVDLESIGAGTRLTLTHSRFTNEEAANAHDQGWIGVLSTLESFVKKEQSQ